MGSVPLRRARRFRPAWLIGRPEITSVPGHDFLYSLIQYSTVQDSLSSAGITGIMPPGLYGKTAKQPNLLKYPRLYRSRADPQAHVIEAMVHVGFQGARSDPP
jgi:hypothetical protein